MVKKISSVIFDMLIIFAIFRTYIEYKDEISLLEYSASMIIITIMVMILLILSGNHKLYTLQYNYDIEKRKMEMIRMENIQILVRALEYIENNLTESIKTEDIANHLYCSKSTIEKLFRYFNNISIRDYLIRRRMSKAALDIVRFPKKSLLDIGMEYGYGSNEAFSRAFFKVWHVSPSEFRKNPSKYELFPRFNMEQELMEEKKMSNRKKVDISELYDCIKERNECFMVIGDIRSLIPINDISIQAGDLAIITAMKRMENAAGEDDIVFRVGGDEFVILTNSTEAEYANGIVDEILSHNGEIIVWENNEIPLSMYAKCFRLEETNNIRYSELFTKIQDEISEDFKRQALQAL